MFKRFRELLLGRGSATPSTGARGEQIAAEWLKTNKRFHIIAQNWRSPHDRRDELDLVARDGAVLVFVEVKTRSASARVSGYHAVDKRKRKVLRRGCDAYLRGLSPDVRPKTFRFDVVEIGWTSESSPAGAPSVRHFENVALFPKYYRP